MNGSGPKQFNCPRGLKLNNNKLYVCDAGNHRIQVFDSELNHITSIGSGKGSGPGQFDSPWDISFDDSSMLHVADCNNDRIQVLDQDGRFVREYGQLQLEDMELSFIHVDHDYVYVTLRKYRCVCVHSTISGELVHAIGVREHEMQLPLGVVVDSDRFVYVCDYSKSNVQIF